MGKEVFKLVRGIALTGSIGVGKSTVTECLRKRGWMVLESDRLARELVMPGKAANQDIREAFGDEVFGPGEELDRARLAEIVFRDPEKRRRLEEILHPKIRAQWLEEAEKAEKEGNWVAVDVPLLYETGADKHFKTVVVVACLEKTQQSRLRKRGWSNKQAQERLKAQIPQQEKIDRADRVIWNEFSTKNMEEQLQRVMDAVQKEKIYAS